MNYKITLATLLAAGLVSSQSAQSQLAANNQKDVFFDPDFLLTVPLDLTNIPGEIYEAVVWCEIKDGNRVIAETGGVSISVDGHQACARPQASQSGTLRDRPVDTGAPCPGFSGYRKPDPWSVKKILGTYSPELLQAANLKAQGKVPDLNGVPFDKFHIGDKPPTARADVGRAGTNSNAEKWDTANPGTKIPSITLRASTPGAVAPASAETYTCHVGFKADVLIDGQHQNITVFGLDPGTLKTIPYDRTKQFNKEISGPVMSLQEKLNLKK